MIDRRGKWALAAIIATLAIVYLVGNARIPLWDRDEPRNAQAARQMYQSGDWVVPRFLDQVRTAKPVFTYWCQVLAMHVWGDDSFAARLPSAIGMTLTLLVLGIVLYRKVSPEHAIWTVIIVGTSAMVIAWCARNALTDGMLLLWITIAQLCLYHVYSRGAASWARVVVWAIAVGLAGLTKGPVILAVQGMTLLALLLMRWIDSLISRRNKARGFEVSTHADPHPGPLPEYRAREKSTVRASSVQTALKVVVALAIVAAIVTPWLYLVEKRSPGFILTTASHDVLRRITEPLEQHKGPPGYYFFTAWATFFPWSLFLPMALIFGWRHRADDKVKFAFAAVIGPWLMFEFFRTKLPHYVLPCFPALAYLTADALVRCFRGKENDLLRPSFLIAAAIWAMAVLALGLAPWLAIRMFNPIPIAATLAWTIVAIAYAATVFALFVAEKPKIAAGAMAGGMVAAMLIAYTWYLPSASFFRLSVCLADALKRDGATIPGQVQMIAYKEPSLVFYQGGTIREQPENDFLLTHPESSWPRWLTIRSDIWTKMPPDVRDKWIVLAATNGWAYADKGKIVEVFILRKKR
jgi:4-amino-4-deoxy-L-arabinose transferase-like glycosyltransferase